VVAHAERLPIRVYTTADGLGQNTVNRIVRDSRGFLWFSTDEGLSRFDGYAFTNYTIAHGLPHPVVQDVLETRSGVYWVGTGGGLYRFNPSRLRNADFGLQNEAREIRDLQSAIRNSSEPMFVLYRPNDNSTTGTVNVLLEDRSGAVWCGAGRGLYRLEQTNGQWTLGSVEIGLPREVENDMRVRALVENRQGDLWIGAESGLYRRRPDGRTARYTTEQGLPANEVRALLVDTNGHLWVGTRSGVVRIEPEPTTDQLKIIRVYTAKDGLRNPNTRSLFQSSTGRLWVGSSTMLVELVPNENQAGSRLDYDVSELGLSKLFVQTLAEDRDGNLWIGTDNGALKLARNGFTTYTEADGLGESRVSALFESRGGDLGVVTLFSSATPLSWFEGKRFKAIRPQLPRGLTYFGWGWHQLILQDQAGEWWLPTGQGLVRYPKVNHLSQLAVTPPKAIYTTKDGLVSNDVFRLYEDSRGDIWMATFSEARSGITRWERARERFHHYGEADGLPLRTPIPYSFGEDRAGNVWIGCGDADSLARFSNGRFTLFTSEHGVPAGKIHGLYLDNAGRLWIGSTTGGLARLDDPSAERPRFITYTTAQGLSSSSINCITEDRYGRLYIGTARGVDRLDPATGRVKQFTSADGLITGEVVVSVRDRNGDLWFGGQDGLSRLSPQLDPPQSPPLILINGVRVAGNQQPISALGETALSLPDLTVDRNQLQVDFVGLSFAPGESLRYQYRLAGADREWSAPTDQRTVNYANLAPGTYQFFVRAINSNGMASPTPATIHFTILPPVWQRWWFVMLAALVLSLIGYVGYRTRVAQLLALERVRTRIATDLHDDIGSSLSRIAILSEVVKQQPDIPRQDSAQMLGEVAETARGLMEAMSDIVWAIDPRRDDLNNLVYRIRRFASDVLEAKHIRCEFQVPTGLEQIKLTPEQRRHVYLIFKEAIHNIVRHADCTAVSLAINVSDHQLVADIRDDGRGFAQPPGGTDFNEGHGLESMRNRAAQLGGQLKIDSAPGSGTCVKLSVPLK
jgi:ligand-binding sensor domain-containing protein/two-component sensor histidine kinase